MDLHLPAVALGSLELSTWTLLGRVPVSLALLALALSLVGRAGWRRAALALSGVAAGMALGVAVLPSVLGALAGAVLGGGLTLRLLGAPLPGALPVAAGLLAVVGVGRFGCLLNGCCFGTRTDLPWAVRQPPGAMAAAFHERVGLVAPGAASAPIHPWPLYEALGVALLLAALVPLRRRVRGGPLALGAAAGYLLLRAALDPLRAMVNTTWSAVPAGPLSAFQWAALAAAAACLGAAVLLARREPLTAALTAPHTASVATPLAAPLAAPAPAPALALAWLTQAALVAFVAPRLTAFLAAVAAATLAASGALVAHAVLADASGRVALRRAAVALAALLLVPAGLRAADGAEPGAGTPARRWVYAALQAQEAPPPAAEWMTGPAAPTPAGAPPVTEGDPARLVRIGDQDTPPADLEARAKLLEVRRTGTVSAFAGGGTLTYQSGGESCGGPVTYYDRSRFRAGLSYERATSTLEDGVEIARDGWQVRGSYATLSWSDRLESGSQGVTELGHGSGERWTVGGLHEWERPGVAFGLGGLVGQDTTRDPLGRLFTSGQLVLHPGVSLRAGWRGFGVEGGTLLAHDPTDQPYLGLYFGPPTARLRLGLGTPYPGSDASTTGLSADLRILADRTWLQLHVNAYGGYDATVRLGFDLP